MCYFAENMKSHIMNIIAKTKTFLSKLISAYQSLGDKKKSILYLVLMGVIVFWTYSKINPSKYKEYENLADHAFSLDVFNINESNKWSQFKYKKNGEFFVHPGEQLPSKGLLRIKERGQFKLEMSIAEGSEVGDVIIVVKKNGINLGVYLVSVDNSESVQLDVRGGDEFEISVDKHGDTNSDWVNLKVSKKVSFSYLTQMIIPVVWIALFIFLFFQKQVLSGIVAYGLFLLMLYAEKSNLYQLDLNESFVYSFIAIGACFTFILIQELSTRFNLQKYFIAPILNSLLTYTIMMIPIAIIIYQQSHGISVGKESCYAVFQTNFSESMEYIKDYIGFFTLLLPLILAGGIAYVFYRQSILKLEKINMWFLVFNVLAFGGLSLSTYKNLPLPKLITTASEVYSRELELFKQVQEERKTGKIKFEASKESKGETYVVVIGESLNKRHMGLYGYSRNTTPNLSALEQANDLLVFDNCYSNHTHTVQSLSLALTEANQLNGKKYFESLSIIDILNKADIETYWITNQVLKGDWDNLISVIANEADYLKGFNNSIGTTTNTQNYDEVVVKKLNKILAKRTNKNRVVFIHLMGNHSYYENRYPKEKFTKFTEKLAQGQFGKQIVNSKEIHIKKVNTYDNSVLYNDFVIHSIIEELKQTKGVTGLLYVPDHADDVIGGGGHNSGLFTFEMTQIPMILWCSEQYKTKHKDQYINIRKNQNKLFCNDMIYNTLIGLIDVKTDRHESQYDLSSADYVSIEQYALAAHGWKKYTKDPLNYQWIQKNNIQYLFKNKLDSRIFPHRVNSTGKLLEVWSDGFRSFAIHVILTKDEENKYRFQVGHGKGEMGYDLETFLSTIDYIQIQRVWLDFKNLNKQNMQQALTELNRLDKKYNLKPKFIVESGTTNENFAILHQSGWHTSYYLPTVKIVDLLKRKNKSAMNQLAKIISQQVKRQQLDAVSFDHQLYPFVKNYLEKKLAEDIVYHTWYTPDLFSNKFIQDLEKNQLYKDPRVKTMLCPYKSPFNL